MKYPQPVTSLYWKRVQEGSFNSSCICLYDFKRALEAPWSNPIHGYAHIVHIDEDLSYIQEYKICDPSYKLFFYYLMLYACNRGGVFDPKYQEPQHILDLMTLEIFTHADPHPFWPIVVENPDHVVDSHVLDYNVLNYKYRVLVDMGFKRAVSQYVKDHKFYIHRIENRDEFLKGMFAHVPHKRLQQKLLLR